MKLGPFLSRSVFSLTMKLAVSALLILAGTAILTLTFLDFAVLLQLRN